MPNDINKLRRLMRTAHVLQKGDEDHKYGQSLALKQAWWFESFRDALSNGFARFTYIKKDGTFRTALGTRSSVLIPTDKLPQCLKNNEEWDERAKSIPYFDLDKREWRSFSVLNFLRLDEVWRFNDPWISAKDRLPERMTSRDSNGAKIINCCSKNVFGYDDWNKIGRLVCYNHESEEWESRDGYRIGIITHWMPTMLQSKKQSDYETML